MKKIISIFILVFSGCVSAPKNNCATKFRQLLMDKKAVYIDEMIDKKMTEKEYILNSYFAEIIESMQVSACQAEGLD